MGVLAADVVKDQSRTVMLEVTAGVIEKIKARFQELEQLNRAALFQEGFADAKQRHVPSLAARYKGQSFELELTQTTGDIAAAFHRAHLARYGYAQRSDLVEIVAVRLRSSGIVKPLKQSRLPKSRAKVSKPPAQVETVLDGKRMRVGLYARDELSAEMILQTPCIVTEYSSTTLIASAASAKVDSYGNLIISV